MALTDGLVAHYLLNNNADDSFGSYDGTDTDVNYTGEMGVFNGTTSKIAIPSLGLESSFSFSFWVYTDDNSIQQRIVAYNDITDNLFFIGRILDTGKLNLYVKSSTPLDIDSTTTLSNGTIYHMFVNVNENGTCELFIDSVSENSGSIEAFIVAVEGDRYIGCSRHSDSSFTNGGVSNVRFYNNTKNQVFVDELYAEGYSPVPSSSATVSVTSTASASNVGVVNPQSSATVSVSATASAYDSTTSPKSSATVSVSATANAYDANSPSSSATVTVLATANAYIAVADIVKFKFVQEIEQPPTQAVFKFIQEIEQPSTSTIIERTNV